MRIDDDPDSAEGTNASSVQLKRLSQSVAQSVKHDKAR